MSDTDLYWRLRGDYVARKAKLAKFDRTFLEAAILDATYNDFLSGRADIKQDEQDPHDYGKRLPYIGWVWRHLEFSAGYLPLGNCGSFIGFMVNNKWGYSNRDTTPEEFAKIMAIIDEAMHLNEQGGLVSEIVEKTNAKLDELWAYLQTLEV